MPEINRRSFVLSMLISAALLGAAATGLVLARSGPPPAAPPTPVVLSVETRPVLLQDGFRLQRTFSGRVQARRESMLGFESPGRLERVLVDEGAQVEAGQLLAELDTDRLQAQRAERVAAKAEAEANLALAEVTLDRLRAVIEKGGVSRQGLDEAREAQHAARAALRLAGQRIASLDVELAKARLLAPFAATVVARSADEGQVLDGGRPVLTLQERSTPEIRIGIAGPVLDRLQAGQLYRLAWRNGTLQARLRALLPLRAATARTVDALFDPVEPAPGLLPGDLVTLALDQHIEQRGSWLPLTALAEGERGLWSLYLTETLAQADNPLAATHRIVRRTVDVVHQENDRVFVRGALRDRQRVVVTGLQRIVPGQFVRLRPETITIAEVSDD